jgi:hypothetical protein
LQGSGDRFKPTTVVDRRQSPFPRNQYEKV